MALAAPPLAGLTDTACLIAPAYGDQQGATAAGEKISDPLHATS